MEACRHRERRGVCIPTGVKRVSGVCMCVCWVAVRFPAEIDHLECEREGVRERNDRLEGGAVKTRNEVVKSKHKLVDELLCDAATR